MFQERTLTAFNRLTTPPITDRIHGTGITALASFTILRTVMLAPMLAISTLDSRSEVAKSRSLANSGCADWAV